MISNQFPTLHHPHCRLAIIADAPGKEEIYTGKPFVGSGGRLLRSLISRHNLTLEHCFLGYLSPTQPPDDDFDKLDFQGPEISQGITQLNTDLRQYKPNCTLLLGSGPFRAFAPGGFDDFSEEHRWGVGKIRGSVLLHGTPEILPPGNNKYLPTYDPSYILRAYYELPFLKNDLARAVDQSRFAELRPTVRNINIRPTFEQVCDLLRTLRTTRIPAGFDVEGWNDNVGVTMYSIATSPTESVVVAFWLDGKHYWSLEQEAEIWRLTAEWLQDPNCPKIVTNAMYELFIMAWKHRIIVVNILEDTMFKQWEIYPELSKSLATQISLWTLEPYYKDDRTSTDPDTKLLYSGKDPALSYECSLAQDAVLSKSPAALAHYRFNCDLIPAIGYMQLRGCKFDKQVAAGHTRDTEQQLLDLQPRLDELVLQPALAAGIVTRKRKSDPYHFNVKSVPQKKWLLYEHLGYKPSARKGQSTDEVTILKYYMKEKNPILKLLLDGVSLRTRLSDIEKLTSDADGRIRSNFNLVGTDTARLSSRESNAMEATFTKTGILHWENTGTNLQNVTKELRDCFIPDTPEHAFFECDLSGADGWTVAADLAAVGHSTMLDDYLAGIKPAKVLLLMLDEHERGGNPARINHLDRSTLRSMCKAIKFPDHRDEQGRPGDWKYLCMKRVQHGCVTAGHEVLTPTGWKPIEQLTQGESVLTWDQGASVAFWDTPSKLTNFDYTGKLYTFKGTAYDLEVTQDHRIPFETNGNPKVCTAGEMYTRQACSLPVSARSYHSSAPSQPATKWIEQLAAYQSDGFKTTCEGYIGFHLKRQRKIDRLMNLFGSDCKAYVDNNNPGAHTFIYYRPDLYDKKATDWSLLSFSSDLLTAYIEETLKWDGSTQESENHKRCEITTVDKQRAEVLNTVAHLSGYGSQLTLNAGISGFGSLIHSISLNQRLYTTRATLNEVQSKTVNSVSVYCVTVKTGFFFVRRNNKIMITGNSNYDMQPELLATTIFKDSEGLIDLTVKDASLYQYLYKLRYNVDARKQDIIRRLAVNGSLTTAGGTTRKFFDLRNRHNPEPAVVRSALSFEPQFNTTYATNLAFKNLWYDPANRTSRSTLHIEPLLLVHDALAGQFKRKHAEWAVNKVTSYFQNDLIIHGIKIRIPFEGKYGTSWRNCKEFEFAG